LGECQTPPLGPRWQWHSTDKQIAISNASDARPRWAFRSLRADWRALIGSSRIEISVGSHYRGHCVARNTLFRESVVGQRDVEQSQIRFTVVSPARSACLRLSQPRIVARPHVARKLLLETGKREEEKKKHGSVALAPAVA